MIEVFSVGGRSPITAIRNTVLALQSNISRQVLSYMFSMAEIPSVIFSPDSLGIIKTNREMTLMRNAGRM